MTVASAERGLGNVFGRDANLVVAAAQVQLAEVFRSLQAIEELVHQGKRVAVLDGDVVEGTIINAHAHRAILLLHEQDRSSERRLARLDEARLDELFQLFLELLELLRAQADDGTTRGS